MVSMRGPIHASRPNLRLLLTSSSVAALLVGGGVPRAFAGTCDINDNIGAIIGAVTNSTAINCINISNSTNVTGNVTNTGPPTPGTITATGTTAPTATGITINNSTIGGAIINQGTITVTIPSGDSGNGILVTNNAVVSGGISNSGTISVAGCNCAYGINVNGVSTFGGGINNSGSITASVSENSGTAMGVTVSSVTSFSGGITNGGTISVAGGSECFQAVGINVFDVTNFSGGVTNGGTINVTSGSFETFSTGIKVESVNTFNGNITNSSGGVINASVGVCASAAGIRVSNNGNFNGAVINAGSITVTADFSCDGAGAAYGIYVSNVNTFGGIQNSGMISTNGTGIFVGGVSTFTGGITNTGSITGYVGIVVTGSGPVTIFDSGYINGTGGKAVDLSGNVNSTPNTFILGPGYDIIGNVLGAGSDIFELGGSTGPGNTFSLNNIGSQYIGFATFNVVSATWVLTGSGSQNWSISSGATLQLGDGIAADGGTITGNIVDNGTFAIDHSDNYTFGGTISGTGGLVQMGTGITTLTGQSSYTGPTAVNAGTLQAGGTNVFAATSAFTVAAGAKLDLNNFSNTIGSLAGGGNVTLGSGTLTMGGNNNSTTYSGTISGTGGIVKNGTGNFFVTGTNTYSGPTTINGGIFDVTGAITSSSSVSINNGATLTGTGLVDPDTITIASGATLIPGTAGSPGTSLTLNGTLVVQSGAAYVIYLNPTTSTFTTVNGTASLNGAVDANFATGSYVSKKYPILTATGGVSGTFSSLVNFNLPPFATDSLTYDANDAYLVLLPGFTAYTGLNVNQQSVANALTNYFNSTGGIPASFFGLSPNGLTQIDGEVAADAERGSFLMMDQFLELLLDPFVDGRSGAGWPLSGGAATANSFAPDESANLPPDIAQAYAAVLKAPPPPTFNQRWTAWAAGFGASGTSNGDPVIGSTNVTASEYGYAAGMDYHLTPDTVAGFGLAGGGTNWSLAQGLGTGRSDDFQAGLYMVTRSGPYYLAGAVAFANHWMSTNRIALGDQLTASFDGQGFGARLEGGYRYAASFNKVPFGVTPYAAIQWQSFDTPPYSETDLTGGGFGLSYNAMTATDTRSELGARFDAPTMLGAMPLIFRGRVAWAHDWVNAPALGASFATLPGTGFTVIGAPLPQNSARTTAGAVLHMTANWSLAAKFDGQFADGTQVYGGSGTLRYTW
jgi:autotransporter-associated beta strand protein